MGPKDVSGLAVIGSDAGILVSDETHVAQQFRLDRVNKTIIAGETMNLLPGAGKELDLEAAAPSSDGKWVYATGSHGVSRKSGEVKPDRSHVFRIAPTQANADVAVSTLVPLIESDATLRGSLRKTSAQGGLDIESIAERDGRLFFGMRSPSVEGHAFVIETSTEALFADPNKTVHCTHALALGERLGIRDLVRVSDGFVLIAGKAMNDKSSDSFVLHHWQGPDGKLTKIGEVPKTPCQAEGLLVLEESADKVTVLVVFDGQEKGGPMELTLTKPPS
jgi:hypothetical protein